MNGECWYTYGQWTQGSGGTGNPHGTGLAGHHQVWRNTHLRPMCLPYSSGYVNSGLRMTATAANELDMSNNTARIGHPLD